MRPLFYLRFLQLRFRRIVRSGECRDLAGAAGLRRAEDLRLAEPVARVCREVCRENVCRTRCADEHVRDEVVHERVYRDHDRDEHRIAGRAWN